MPVPSGDSVPLAVPIAVIFVVFAQKFTPGEPVLKLKNFTWVPATGPVISLTASFPQAERMAAQASAESLRYRFMAESGR